MLAKISTLLALGLSVVVANSCGGNCPSNSCSTCYCGTGRESVNIASACSQYSGWSQSACQCIASHESGGNAHAQLHNTNGSNDVGLWQVNSMNWACQITLNHSQRVKMYYWNRYGSFNPNIPLSSSQIALYTNRWRCIIDFPSNSAETHKT